MGPRAGLEDMEERKFLDLQGLSYLGSNIRITPRWGGGERRKERRRKNQTSAKMFIQDYTNSNV
jgi:hypothetical protein